MTTEWPLSYPDGPVILVHLRDEVFEDLTACGAVYAPATKDFPYLPRVLCLGCARRNGHRTCLTVVPARPRHRYQATCSCGWAGPIRHRLARATSDQTDHYDL